MTGGCLGVSTLDAARNAKRFLRFKRLKRRCIGRGFTTGDWISRVVHEHWKEASKSIILVSRTMYVTRAYDTSSYFKLEGQTFECRCAVLSSIRSTGEPLETWTAGNLVRERKCYHAMPSCSTKTRQIWGTNLPEVSGAQEQSARPRGSTATELTCVNGLVTMIVIHSRVRGSDK